MGKSITNWFPNNDRYTKDGEIKLHEKLHNIKFKNGDLRARNDRLQYISDSEGILGKKISGYILDIGCGNGYSSVHLAKSRDIKQVHALECDFPAVNKLIRSNFKTHNIAESKYELICGSFNDIKNTEFYNYVISLGAIHHSGSLIRTMKSIFNSLKPGGAFIAHEPYMNSFTPNSLYIKKEDTIKKVQGLISIKESERDDHFFRECEYLTAFHHSGFNIKCFKNVGPKSDINSALIVLEKPKELSPKIPHAWF